ncbi:MAG: hypothetical protein QOF62_2790 [Pyrinomonadaceae bacterium]|jgi:hypothetical protein|nr:hypothetical protein [Pyrinomonadaceae bacterium]
MSCGFAAFRAERLCLSVDELFIRGCASGDVEAQPQKLGKSHGKAKPFRTEGDKAARPD